MCSSDLSGRDVLRSSSTTSVPYCGGSELAAALSEEIDELIEKELSMVKERLAELQEKRKAAVQMYDAACTMLGIEIEPEESTG